MMQPEVTCPICKKAKLFFLCGMIVCCYCQRMSQVHEFASACRAAGIQVDVDERKNLLIHTEEGILII